MLRIKRAFSHLPNALPHAKNTTSRNNRYGAPWSRLIASNSYRAFTGLSARLHYSSHVGLMAKTSALLEKAPYMDKTGLEKAIEAEQGFPLRALIERYPQLKSHRFRDLYERYGDPGTAIGDAMPADFREAMSTMEEMFVAQIRKGVLESLKTAIQRDTPNFGTQLEHEEAWKEANQIRTILECSAFAHKYPNHPFASVYQDMVVRYKLNEPGALEAVEHMKGVYTNDVLLNGTLQPGGLWRRYKYYSEWSTKGFVEHEAGAKHVIFEVLPLLLPQTTSPSGSPVFILNKCELSGNEEKRGKALARSHPTLRPCSSWFFSGDHSPIFLGQKYHDSSHLYDVAAKSGEYVEFREATQIGQMIELFEEAFRNKILDDERVLLVTDSYNEEEALKDLQQTRTLLEWRIFSLEHRGTVCAEVYREYAKLYEVDDDDTVARWERLRIVAAYDGLRKPLNTRFQDLMDSYRARLAEYRMSSEGQKELANHVVTEVKEEPTDWRWKKEGESEPVVDPLGDIDDETEVKRLFTETFPKVFVKDPVTNKMTLRLNRSK